MMPPAALLASSLRVALVRFLPLVLLLGSAAAWSEDASRDAEARAALEAARAALVRGPTQLVLGEQAHLQLPDGFVFIPKEPARRLMQAMGNRVASGFQGMVVPASRDGSFSFFDVTYMPSGYIKDDDAKDWDAAKLLDSMREATDADNKRRSEMGIDAIELTGWIEQPHYDSSTHQLVWSVGLNKKGAGPRSPSSLNYQTLVLGREGYMEMTLVTDPAHVDEMRPKAATLLNGLTFDSGKRYADFNSNTDHIAEFGLAALVAGVAAKKLGLLALIAALAVKFGKVIVVAAAGLLWAVRRKLGLAKKAAPEVPPQAPPSPPPALPGGAP